MKNIQEHIFNRRRDRGRVMMVFIVIFTVLFVGLLLTVVAMYERKTHFERKFDDVHQEIMVAESRVRVFREEVKANIVAIEKKYETFFDDGSTEKYKHFPVNELTEKHKSIRDSYFPINNTEVKSVDRMRQTMRDSIVDAAHSVNMHQYQVRRVESQVLIHKNRKGQLQKTKDAVLAIKDATISYLEKEIDKVARMKDEAEQHGNQLFAQIEGKVNELDAQIAQEKQEQIVRMQKLDDEETEKRKNVRGKRHVRLFGTRLVYNIFKSHGTILQADPENKSAFISIGREDRVVKGLLFEVVIPGAEFGYQYRGLVEVMRVFNNRSQVNILDVFDLKDHPIKSGDLLLNPLFDTRRSLSIALIGNLPIDDNHTERILSGANRRREEYFRRLLDIGSTPTKHVNVHTDFALIFAEREGDTSLSTFRQDDEDYKIAQELNIPIFTVSKDDSGSVTILDLLKYIDND